MVYVEYIFNIFNRSVVISFAGDHLDELRHNLLLYRGF